MIEQAAAKYDAWAAKWDRVIDATRKEQGMTETERMEAAYEAGFQAGYAAASAKMQEKGTRTSEQIIEILLGMSTSGVARTASERGGTWK